MTDLCPGYVHVGSAVLVHQVLLLPSLVQQSQLPGCWGPGAGGQAEVASVRVLCWQTGPAPLWWEEQRAGHHHQAGQVWRRLGWRRRKSSYQVEQNVKYFYWVSFCRCWMYVMRVAKYRESESRNFLPQFINYSCVQCVQLLTLASPAGINNKIQNLLQASVQWLNIKYFEGIFFILPVKWISWNSIFTWMIFQNYFTEWSQLKWYKEIVNQIIS